MSKGFRSVSVGWLDMLKLAPKFINEEGVKQNSGS